MPHTVILASALIIVVTLTCTMSYFQERSASNVMGELCFPKGAACACRVQTRGSMHLGPWHVGLSSLHAALGSRLPTPWVRIGPGDLPAMMGGVACGQLVATCSQPAAPSSGSMRSMQLQRQHA